MEYPRLRVLAALLYVDYIQHMNNESMGPVSSDRAFALWAGKRNATLSAESLASYRNVWDGWVAFALGRGLRWDTAKSGDVRDFLQALPARASARGIRAPSSVTQKRYFRVLRDIYVSAASEHWIDVVPADKEAAVSSTEAHESLVFHRGQWGRLFAALPELREPVPDGMAWTQVRNVALLLLMMQAALSVSELAALNVCDVRTPRLHMSPAGTPMLDLPYPPWDRPAAPTMLHVSGARPDQTRALVLGPPAQAAVMAWLGLRLEMALHDGLLSPLFISRKGAGRLTSKTLFTIANEHIQKTLGPELADVALAHAGPMTLRNSCIVRWLDDAGLAEAEVLRRAGLKDALSLARLRQHVVRSADMRSSASTAIPEAS